VIVFETIDGPEAKPPRWTIGRGAYFAWWVLEGLLGFACVWAINNGQLEDAGGDPRGASMLAVLAVSAVVAALLIRVITVILRLKDFGASAWVSILAFIPIANLIVDGFLIFKPGAQGQE
jgi:uncharacterized membrane protein YhaH (DUF805 family)